MDTNYSNGSTRVHPKSSGSRPTRGGVTLSLAEILEQWPNNGALHPGVGGRDSILPGMTCDGLGMEHGSTYGEALAAIRERKAAATV